MRSERSCKWLILSLSPLPSNIHIKGQYPNCDSIQHFNKTLLCLMFIKFGNLARTEIFLPAFLHNKDTYSLNSYLFANLVTFAYSFPKFFHLQFEPKHFHVYSQTPIGGIYLDLISYYYFETIQLLVSYHVPLFLSRSLDFRHRQKMWYHQQNYKLQ